MSSGEVRLASVHRYNLESWNNCGVIDQEDSRMSGKLLGMLNLKWWQTIYGDVTRAFMSGAQERRLRLENKVFRILEMSEIPEGEGERFPQT